MGRETLEISGTKVAVDIDMDKAVKLAELLGFTTTRDLFRFQCSRCGWGLHVHFGGTPHFNHNPGNPKSCPRAE